MRAGSSPSGLWQQSLGIASSEGASGSRTLTTLQEDRLQACAPSEWLEVLGPFKTAETYWWHWPLPLLREVIPGFHHIWPLKDFPGFSSDAFGVSKMIREIRFLKNGHKFFPPIKKYNLFLHPLKLGWPHDMFWPIEY